MKITKNQLKEIIREVIIESTLNEEKKYFKAPKKAKYKDESDVEKHFKKIPRNIQKYFTKTSSGIEINSKFKSDSEEVDDNIDDGTEHVLDDYVVIIDKRDGKNLMGIIEFTEEGYPYYAADNGI